MWKNDQVTRDETLKILEVAKKCLSIPGDFVEFGCFEGDTSLKLAEIIDFYVKSNKNALSKRLWLYDSFEGLPEKAKQDFSEVGRDFQRGELFTTKRVLKERFLRANLPLPVIKKAWFSELGDADLPTEVAFAFVDGDFYESTKEALSLLERKVKGAILVHDYQTEALPGVTTAVDEWLSGHKNAKMTVFQRLAMIEM